MKVESWLQVAAATHRLSKASAKRMHQHRLETLQMDNNNQQHVVHRGRPRADALQVAYPVW
jgi:hypothetical protein